MMRFLHRITLNAIICAFFLANLTATRADVNTNAGIKRCLFSNLQRFLTEKAGITDPVTPEKIKAVIAESIRHGMQPKVIATKTGKFVLYPTIAPLHLISITTRTLTQHGLTKDLVQIPFEYLKQDGTTILGFVLFTQAVEKTPIKAAEYYLLPKNTNGKFEDDTSNTPRSDGTLVYVDAIPDNNSLTGYGESDFNTRFSKRDGAYYVRVSSVSNMMQQLQDLSQQTGKPIGELEILGHGLPGSISIGNEKLTSSKMYKVDGYGIPFAKDATIRLQSCFLGANFRGPLGKPGEDFMNSLGRSLLNHGGTVIASNHIIYVTDHFPKSAKKYHEPWLETYWDMVLQPLEATIIAAIDALKTSDGSYRKVRIPGQ